MTLAPLALITGGKRRLGSAIAARLAKAGYALALVSHVDKGPDAALAAVMIEQKTDWECFECDLSAPENTGALINAVTTHFGRVPDLLVNNAAMFGQDDWQDVTEQSLNAHFALNTFTPVLLAQKLVLAAGESAQPAIVNILDQRIVNPHRDQLAYTLSKQALAASVRTLAASFGKRARINGVAPGLVIATDDYTADQEIRLADMMPLGALPSPSGVADAVLYLAGAKEVTGQIIMVDGGAHLKSFERDFQFL
jgi:pteridine reductase